MITYVVGGLALQVTLPRWTKHPKRRGPLPFFTQGAIWDSCCFPIWPAVTSFLWPPPKYMEHAALDDFHKRFKTVDVQVGKQ